MSDKLAIVGVFYDGYYDMWEDFLELFNRNWPDCPYSVYIVGGTRNLDFTKNYNVTMLHAGDDAEYSKKVQTALREIDADYYLLLLEDFFMEKPIFSNPMEDILTSMSRYNISYLRMPMPEFQVGKYKKKNKHDEKTGFAFISSKSEYTVTCQPSVWKKDFLKRCIGKGNYNAWIFEGVYAYAQIAHTDGFLNKCRVCFSNPLNLRHGAVQGKILPNVYEDIRKTGYEFKNKREILDTTLFQKHLRKQRFKSILPLPIQKAIKKVFKSGSVLERYKDQIIDTMKSIGIE